MELITLDANNQAKSLVEGFDSLIWTERFNTVGDFQLVTGNVSKFMAALPEGQVVSLRETNVPMIVETHEIETPERGPDILTIRGREYESILDRRAAVQTLNSGSTSWAVVTKIPSDVAYYIIVKICVEGILDAAAIFPAAQVQFPTPADYLAGTGPNRSFEVPRGNLLNVVLQFLQEEAKADATTTPPTPEVVPHGIRSVRPSASGTAIAIQIYKGVDRTQTVYFDATRDLLKNGKYLFSKVGSANVAYGIFTNTSVKMSKNTTTPSGLARRVILVDGATSGSTDANVLQAHMSQALQQAKEISAFTGQINADISPYKFGVDYNLGDVVKVVGEYGLDQKARVTEYIRSQTKEGYRAYPTLTTIDDFIT
jgi:hypothetical protein